MRKFTARLTETETQTRSRIVDVEVYIPDGLSDPAALKFAVELLEQGQATPKPVIGIQGQWTEWSDEDTKFSY